LCAVFFASSVAIADDSSAVLGTGGLVLTKSANIRMAREDLRISPSSVKVRYEFANGSGKDVDTIVAFPLPDIDLYEFSGSPLGTVKEQTPNFVGFELTVDGKRVQTTAEEKAVYKGKDVTAKVRAAGLPINMAGTDLYKRLPKLSLDARRALVRADLLEIDGPKGEDVNGDDFHPKWTAETKFWWRQRFPAGKTVVIEHSYQPVTGQSFFSDTELSSKDSGSYYAKNYCIDEPTKTAVRARLAARKHTSPDNPFLNAYTTDFILTTANNWKGPIGSFHLTLDKLRPDNVLSLCWADGLKKTGETTFEWTRENLAPKHDVRMLVVGG
jgi:hypothetical protein